MTGRTLVAGAAMVLGGAGALLTALALGAVTLPLFRLPPPSGPFTVGTMPLLLGGWDAQAWYPAQPSRGDRRARYDLRRPRRPLARRVLGALVRTEAVSGARPRAGRYPVLLYVAGWGGLRSDNTALAQSLASHGFIVVGLDDPYPSPSMDFSSAQSFERTLRWGDEKVTLQAQAARSVLQALRSPAAGRLGAAMDLRRVGAFGFSFGGAVAAELAVLDPDVGAVADLDGWLFGAAAKDGVDRPFLIASSTLERKPASRRATALRELYFAQRLDEADDAHIRAGFGRFGGYLLQIIGAGHNNFADAGLLPSLRRTGAGPIDGWRAGRILDAYVAAFFDQYLNRKPAPLLGARPAKPIDEAAILRVWPAFEAKRAAASD